MSNFAQKSDLEAQNYGGNSVVALLQVDEMLPKSKSIW
jgi:hypothetical protein